MVTLNHEKTKVMLITNGEFPAWGNGSEHNIPNVKANAERLKKVFNTIIGIPEENIFSFYNYKASDILKEFQKIIKKCVGADSTIIIYYAGHGVPISGQGLYWTTYDTTTEDGELIYSTAVDTTAISKMLVSNCNAERKILIADCCYAAEFLKGNQGDVPSFIEKKIVKIEGTFYMFSSNADSESTFPIDKADHPTFFTEALLQSITEGIDPEYPYCTIGQLYKKVEDTIGKLKNQYDKVIPSPYKRVDSGAEEYILYLNPNYSDEVEKELTTILADPNKIKIVGWLKKYPKHNKRIEALNALKAYDSAETEIKNVKSLPADKRSAALLDLALKNLGIQELYSMAMDIYTEESGLSANPEKQLESATPKDSIHNNTINPTNSSPRSA